jgi:hypothetical protein
MRVRAANVQIVTWNCRQGGAHDEHLAGLAPDVAILPEWGPPAVDVTGLGVVVRGVRRGGEVRVGGRRVSATGA